MLLLPPAAAACSLLLLSPPLPVMPAALQLLQLRVLPLWQRQSARLAALLALSLLLAAVAAALAALWMALHFASCLHLHACRACLMPQLLQQQQCVTHHRTPRPLPAVLLPAADQPLPAAPAAAAAAYAFRQQLVCAVLLLPAAWPAWPAASFPVPAGS